MKDNSILFFRIIHDFFEISLSRHKRSNVHTIKVCRLTLNQFLDYAIGYLNIKLSNFSFLNTFIKLIEEFLNYEEEKLGWSKKTRNLKLVAIQSFYKLSSNHYISLMFYYLEPQNILKKNNF